MRKFHLNIGMKTWALVALFLFFPLASFAQNSAGVGISPATIEQSADPGAVIEQEIVVSNISDEIKTYFLFTRDISSVRDNGAPLFAEEGAEKTGFEMSSWIELTETEVALNPGEKKTIPVKIIVPNNATPGSHFGGIFISAVPPRLRTIGAGVGFDVANIVSIKINGDVNETAQIRTFSTDKFIYGSTKVDFEARVENKGNVLVRPVGILKVTNMFGKDVVIMNFNESQGGVFPRTIRPFKLLWDDNGTAFGRYMAQISLVYGEAGVSQQTITANTSFWILPLVIIKPALIVLAILLIGTYIAIKLYIRRRVSGATVGRKLGRRGSSRSGRSLFTTMLVTMLFVTSVFLLLLLVIFA